MMARTSKASTATLPAQVSKCSGQNAEVEEAIRGSYVYVEWIGCAGIGFARSTNGGKTYGPSITLPGSYRAGCTTYCKYYSWDPAITVAPSGTVYAAFMYQNNRTSSYPVVDASFNKGATFTQKSSLPVPTSTDPYGNWADRDFIAVGAHGDVFVTWDYGPSSSEIQIICSPIGSCSFTGGDLNAVVQKSTDGGKKWSPLKPISPHFPLGGADMAPIVSQPNGTLDVLYQAFPTDPVTRDLSPGNEYFSRSTDGGTTWSTPLEIGASVGTVSLTEWWIDGDISTDSAGNLYATWDTQSATADVGWLSFSKSGGKTWSKPLNVTPLTGTAEQLTESAGVGKGIADVAWQTPTAKGYATFVRPYSITKGWLTKHALQVSIAYGDPTVWPGDTFGIEALPTARSTSHGRPIVVTWGSAIGGVKISQIFSSVAAP